MQCTYIFLRFIFTIAIQLRIVNAQESTQTYQNGCLYDFFQERLKNLQSNYQSNPLKVGDFKRSLDAKYIGLYDEFKKRLDNFNSALVVDENGQPQEDKRSVGNQCLYDRFKNRLYKKENKFKKISLAEKVKKQVVKESIENKEDTKLIKTKPQTINKSKLSINSIASYEVEPGELHDEYIKHKDVRCHRSLDGQNATYYNNEPEQDENSLGQVNINHLRTKNRNYKKRDDQEAEYMQEPQEFNDKQELEKNNQRSRFKNFAIDDELPFGTNKWSLYPRIFTTHTHIHLPPYLYSNGSKLLQNYSRKMNITPFELAKKIVRLKDTNFIKTILKLLNDGKAQQFDITT